MSAPREASAGGSRQPAVSVDVSITVREPAISSSRTRELVKATLAREGIKDALVSVALVGVSTISRLNRDYLSHDGPTDVISFALGRAASAARTKRTRPNTSATRTNRTRPGRRARELPVIGDIYICQAIAERNARKLGIPLRQELARLVVHGTLHVLGYDHPPGDSRVSSAMWHRQEKILDSVK